MGIINVNTDSNGNFQSAQLKTLPDTKLTPEAIAKYKFERTLYTPTDEEKTIRSMILQQFVLGYTTMYTPRVEFNDLSVIQRTTYDQMQWNTYQTNNGEPATGDVVNSWRSNAVRPVVRNKSISIAAHATARLIFPKVQALNKTNDEQVEAAQVMEDLMEWAAEQSNYAYYALRRTISALTDPASIGYTEYAEVYRTVKRPNGDGTYRKETMLDDTLSGFQNLSVPCDQLYIENFYEPDVQKQGWLIWRRVISYSMAEEMYAKYKNFAHVKPGVQILYNDANASFYQYYDNHMRAYDVEEVRYWNKTLDMYHVVVNGVLLTEPENPNPRNDKRYPFDKFGYELIDNRCFYYKSLAFKLMHDANILNVLYQMIIDGTYLNLMPPMVNTGGDMITSNVIVPGAVTTLSDPNADLRSISLGTNFQAGMNTMLTVEQSLSESSQDPIQQGQTPSSASTAYEISRIEQNAATVLGLFVKMIGDHAKQFGILRMGDILQYLTIAEAVDIEGNPDLVYKTFLLNNKNVNGQTKSRKIEFTTGYPDTPIDEMQQLDLSYQIMREQGGPDSKTELYKVSPDIFRNLKYSVTLSPDVLNPRSDDLERAYNLELYDRGVANPVADQEELYRLLLSTNPTTRRDPDKYVSHTPVQPLPSPQGGASPLAAAMNAPQQPTLTP